MVIPWRWSGEPEGVIARDLEPKTTTIPDCTTAREEESQDIACTLVIVFR